MRIKRADLRRVAQRAQLEFRTPGVLVDETGPRRHNAAAAEAGVGGVDDRKLSQQLTRNDFAVQHVRLVCQA